MTTKGGWLSPIRSSEMLFCQLATMLLRRGKETVKSGSSCGGGECGDNSERTCQNGNYQLPLWHCDRPFDHTLKVTFD
jgi:hypothetical protein